MDKALEMIANGVITRLEKEILSTPSGDLRDLLTDVNIIIRTLQDHLDVLSKPYSKTEVGDGHDEFS